MDFFDGKAGAQSLCCHQDAIGPRFRQCGTEGVVAAIAWRLDLIETGKSRLHAAQAFLQRFGEAAPDRHRLADGFHAGREQRRGAGEFLEGEAWDLHDDVVDRGLEARRRGARNVVGEFVERVSDCQFCRDLGDWKSGRLRSQRRAARYARVHLDHDHAAIGGVHRELHVRSASIHADLAQAGDGGIPHSLIFAVGQGQRRRHGDAVACMDAHRVHVLDAADDDAVVGAVAHDLHLVFLPAKHGFLDQHFGRGRGVEPGADDLFEFLAIIGNTAAGAAQREARTDDRRQSDFRKGCAGFFETMRNDTARALDTDLRHRVAEFQPVLGAVDHIGLGADELDIVFLEGAAGGKLHRRIQRGLSAHRRQQRIRPLARDDLLDDRRRDRLDIGGIGQTRIGHDGRRVRVYQDHPVAFRPQRLAGLRARIVELARLPDHDRPCADNENRGYVSALWHCGYLSSSSVDAGRS